MNHRRGSVLLVVAGLAAILLVMGVVFLTKMRSEAGKSRFLISDAQARVMLFAGLEYIAEASRMGWDREGYGWTDIRDGNIGPRGPVSTGGSIPQPGWWLPAYGAYPVSPAAWPSASILNSGALRWPAPGSAMRGDMWCWKRPPYALELTAAYNPLDFSAAMLTPSGSPWNNNDVKNDRDNPIANAFNSADAALPALNNPGAKGALQPQPAANTWASFVAGDSEAAFGSTNLAWFRVYRETSADKNNDGVPYYDRVAYPTPNFSTFVITCGAGASRGYRFWSLPGSDPRRNTEPVTASESGVFPDQATFEAIRAQERILWYRVEWSPFTGGTNFDVVASHFDGGGQYSLKSSQRLHSTRPLGGLQPRNFTGTFLWIQRLEYEPPAW